MGSSGAVAARPVADLGTAGVAIGAATGTLLSWTAPADGVKHAVRLHSALNVTGAQTGGAVSLAITCDGVATTQPIWNGGLGVALYEGSNGYPSDYLADPGSTVTLEQTSAQTAGAAQLFAQLWAD